MARVSSDLRLHDRGARSRLPVRRNPYWRMICEGQHLGYYRGARGGTWIVRLRSPGVPGNGIKRTLGTADDLVDANGLNVLSWKQALDKAMHWFELQATGATTALDPDITVAQAVTAYIARRDARRATQAGRAVRSDASYKLTRYVLDDCRLAQRPLAALSEADLKAWQQRIERRRATSIQRVANDLKAALNAAWVEHRRALPRDLPIVIRYGLRIEAPAVIAAQARDNQILSDDQVRRVVAAAIAIDEDFGRLVVLLAATGARFAQVRRMCVADVQAGQGRVMVPESFKGKKRAGAHIRVQMGADALAVLAPASMAGRPAPAARALAPRPGQDSQAAKRHAHLGTYRARTLDHCFRNDPTVARGLRRCGSRLAIIPYALRHSSIVRGLRLGLPIRLVAAIHDTSVVMVERHYSRWITEGLDELAARAVVPLVSHAQST